MTYTRLFQSFTRSPSKFAFSCLYFRVQLSHLKTQSTTDPTKFPALQFSLFSIMFYNWMYITLWQNISLRLLICDLIKIVAFHHINNYKDILISDKTVLKSNLFYNRIIYCNVKKQSSWQEYEHYYNISTINTEVFQIHFMTLLITMMQDDRS